MDTRHSAMASILLGRLLVGGFYVFAAVNNLLAVNDKIAYAAFKGVPLAGVAVPIASIVLLLAGLSILTGFRPQLGVLATVCFLAPVTVLMHDFWNQQGVQQITEIRSFLSNVGLLGSALIFLAIPRPWAIGLDDWPAVGNTLRGLVHRPIRRSISAS